MKKYTLMNKNVKLIDFTVNDAGLFCIEKILENKMLPYALYSKNKVSGEDIKYWIEHRCIPIMRPNYYKLLEKMDCKNSYEMVLKNHALSLLDPYWIELEGEDLKWEDINFFDNEYDEDAGLFLLQMEEEFNNRYSPDICTNGVQPKIWIKNNKQDYLLKFGRAPFYQEPINEVICSEIALSFPHITSVEYTKTTFNGMPASKCENFISSGMEFVPALYVYDKKEDVSGNPVLSIIKKAKELDVVNAEEFISEMIMFDSVINNTDRNLGNFGFLRDTDTGEFLCMAPVFDNGDSLWFDEDYTQINENQIKVKPANLTHMEMLGFIKKGNVDFNMLQYNVEKAKNLMAKDISEARLEKINLQINERVMQLSKTIERMRYKSHERNSYAR